jgi:lipoate-protein ligase B
MMMAVTSVQSGEDDITFITEHEAIYTAGKSYEFTDFLEHNKPYKIYYPSRGGRVTVHSKGQIVIYPIINLKKRNIGVIEYVRCLEHWIIRILSKFSIFSFKTNEGIGIWTSAGKIGYVGIRIEKGVSSHGFCINVNNDIGLFLHIKPCGLTNHKITSMAQILGHEIPIQDVAKTIIETCQF